MKEKFKRLKEVKYHNWWTRAVDLGDEVPNWRTYVDEHTIRIEENIDGFWKVQAVILISKYVFRTYKFEVRHYRNPKGHATCTTHYMRVIDVLRDIRGAYKMEIPQTMIDAMESWILMRMMSKR